MLTSWQGVAAGAQRRRSAAAVLAELDDGHFELEDLAHDHPALVFVRRFGLPFVDDSLVARRAPAQIAYLFGRLGIGQPRDDVVEGCSYDVQSSRLGGLHGRTIPSIQRAGRAVDSATRKSHMISIRVLTTLSSVRMFCVEAR